jgi:hypothetical protein
MNTGPFRADQIRPGDPYELSKGHPVAREPSGGRDARANLAGAAVLDTDPAVDAAGVDVGYAPEPSMLRAPDVAVGNVPDEPGWVRGVPPLAVEYADVGQDEAELQEKIRDLLSRGTRFIWVVRLVGPRRVEVYQPESGAAPRTHGPQDELHAPGILRNPVPVLALYDRDAAHDATLRNLLQRRGYESLDQLRAENEARGEARGRIEALRSSCAALMIAKLGAPSPEAARRLADIGDPATLEKLLLDLGTASDAPAAGAALERATR